MTGLSDPREAVGAAYSPAVLRDAQARSWDALHAIAAAIRPGMTEAEAHALGQAILAERGLGAAWHPLLIRFGADTLRIYSEVTDGEAVLGADDIFFIDMGPVFAGHEGDVGATFTTGADAGMIACARDVKVVFDRVRALWDGGAVTGPGLYALAAREAEALGWQLHGDIQGHRVGDFPHRVHNGGRLGDFPGVPAPDLWVLEIQIRHPSRAFGAFHEDLLA